MKFSDSENLHINEITTLEGHGAIPSIAKTDDFYLASWLVEPACNQISYRNGQQTVSSKLEPRLMQLLTLLAANHGQVLSREQLTEQIWPNVIVNENSLTRAISTLRKQLNSQEADDSTTQYIDTITKKGYRLSLHVAVKSCTNSKPQKNIISKPIVREEDDHPSSADTVSPWRPLAIAASLALTLVFLTTYQPMSGSDTSPGIAALNSQSSGSGPGTANNQASSEFAYTIEPQYSKMQAVSRVVPVSASEGPLDSSKSEPILSANGELIAYIEYSIHSASIVVGPNNQTRQLFAIYNTDQLIYNLQWSPVGNALLFARRSKLTAANLFSGEDNAELVMLDLDSQKISVIYNIRREASEHNLT